MFPIGEINSELKARVDVTALFDFYRLVDVKTHEVLEYSSGSNEIIDTNETCHHIWGSDGPCINCTSRSCVLRQQPMVKIMSLDGQYLLIYSMPIAIGGTSYALELIKDITRSLVVPSLESRDNVEITEMVTQFNNLAAHDSFTHLFNKAYALNEIDNAVEHCAKTGETPTLDLVMLDLDLFKNINDDYGHTVGDDVLLMLSRALSGITLKFEDAWAARYGGDEFLLCAPHGIGKDGPAIIAQYLEAFSSDVKKYVNGCPDVSVSFGVATLTPEDTNRTLIDRADQNMYEMKESHHAAMAR